MEKLNDQAFPKKYDLVEADEEILISLSYPLDTRLHFIVRSGRQCCYVTWHCRFQVVVFEFSTLMSKSTHWHFCIDSTLFFLEKLSVLARWMIKKTILIHKKYLTWIKKENQDIVRNKAFPVLSLIFCSSFCLLVE